MTAERYEAGNTGELAGKIQVKLVYTDRSKDDLEKIKLLFILYLPIVRIRKNFQHLLIYEIVNLKSGLGLV